MNRLAWYAMCLTVAVGMIVLGARMGKAQESEPFRGIWCDSQAQIERVVSEGMKLGGAEKGIEAVNKTDGDKACVYGVVIGKRVKTHSVIQSPDGLLDVVEWNVEAIHSPLGLMPVSRETHWYTLEGSKGQEA